MSDNTPTVTASDVGKAEYCPYALYLAKNNTRISSQSKANMKKGDASHKVWDRSRDEIGRKPMPGYIKTLILVIAILLIYFVNK